MADYVRTYSELVDELVVTTGRGDKIANVKSYVNQCIRDSQSLAYFFKDLTEDSITMDGSDPFLWDPLPVDFRVVKAVNFPTYGPVSNLPPGRIQADQDAYYYLATNYGVFKGASQEDTVSVAYYSYLPRLSYYVSGARPAYYDNELDTWYYLDNGVYVTALATTALETAAKNKVTNWLLFTWYDLIRDGAMSKLYYVLDDPRGPKHLGLYKSSQGSLLKGETFESLDQ